MRPHDDKAAKRARSQADVRARLRRELGFIGAVPAGGATLRSIVEPGHQGPPREWRLDPKTLSSAVRAARTLVREAPRALENEVGAAPRRWLAGIERIVGALGSVVHEARPLPDPRVLAGELAGARAARLLAAMPRGPLVDAVCWLHLKSLDELEGSLGWLAPRMGRFGPALEGQPEALVLALRLVRVARIDGERHADMLLGLLADRELGATPLSSPPPPPEGRLVQIVERPPAPGARLIALVEAVLALDDRRRRGAIVLLDRLAPRVLAARWARWWKACDELTTAAALSPHDLELDRALRARLEETPPRLAVEPLEGRLTEWLAAEPADLQCLAEALSLVPEELEGRATRLGMFFLWSVCRDNAPRPTAQLLKRFARYRRTVADDRRALAPWRSYLDHAFLPSSSLWGRCVDHWLVDASRASRRIDAFFGALERSAARDGEVPWAEPGLTSMLAELTATLDGEDAEAFADSVIAARVAARVGTHVAASSLRGGLVLSGFRARDPRAVERFGEIVVRLIEADAEEQARAGDDPFCLAAACRDREVGDVLARLVMRGEVAPVLELGRRLRALQAAGLEAPAMSVPAPRRRAFLRYYPPEMRADLAALAGADPEAEATAAQILGKTFPTPAALADQIVALEKKLARAPDERLATRIASLKRRRAGSTASPAAIAKLRQKLSLAIDRKRVATWSRAAERAFATAVGEALGREPPPWLLEAPMMDLWPHLLSLPASFRRLSVRVVQARLGPYPWDLRDEPANRSFLDRLASRGIRLDAWLDGIGVVRYASRRGDVFLQLERDPIEVLLMGKHFGTCLSPGSMNFFSALANAADVNKRVVYARDAGGAVVGRCLLALTQEGALLAFHAYSHHDDWGFTEHLGDFCLRLVAAMKTTVAESGQVPRLVAPDWYDDGAVDVTGRFEAFSHGSSLEVNLRSVPPPELRALIERELAPARIDPITLPYVLRLVPLAARPELAEPMLAIVASTAGIDLATRELALERAWLAGAAREARGFVAQHIAPRLPAAGVRRPVTMVVLTEIDEPSLALRLLARTRARGVRRWADESDAWRIYAAARAHEALHRRRLAASLYRLALRRAPEPLKALCRERLPQDGA
jgi:hypothetical protein